MAKVYLHTSTVKLGEKIYLYPVILYSILAAYKSRPGFFRTQVRTISK